MKNEFKFSIINLSINFALKIKKFQFKKHLQIIKKSTIVNNRVYFKVKI